MKSKHRSHTLFFILLAPFVLSAQGNFPFPKENAEWQFTTVHPILGPNDAFDIYRNFVEGDSVFNGKLYSKAYFQPLCGCICTANGPFNPANQQKRLIGGVREENNKVYFTTFGQPPFDHYYRPVGDTLLFDFTLQLEDTINYGGYSLRVTQTGTNPDGRTYVRLSTPIDTVWGEPATVIHWTEGIGFWGLLETIPYLNGDYYDNYCFSDDPLDPCPIPCAVTGTATPELETQVKIYPSFAQETVQVELGNGFSKLNLQIYSAQGSLIRSVHEESNTAEINIKNLPVGAYLFVFEASPGVYVSKWYLK